MGENSKIGWTDHTFNPWVGCIEKSPACENCYARETARRWKMQLDGVPLWGPSSARRRTRAAYWMEPLRWDREAAAAGQRRRVFCGSLCDVFEDHSSADQIRPDLWTLIRATPLLDWLLLTKRPEHIVACLPSDWGCGYPNVRLMTTIERRDYVDRADLLRAIPCAGRGISAEPLLSALDSLDLTGIDWVIGGGESGPRARTMQEAWIRDLRDRTVAAGVAFFLKQLGGHPDPRAHEKAVLDGRTWTQVPVLGQPGKFTEDRLVGAR